MERFFNTEGPCEPSRHYMLPALARLPTIHHLIERGKYLVLHAPRQVGKTTALRALAEELNRSGRYLSVVLSMEMGAPYRGQESIGLAEGAILQGWRRSIENSLPAALRPPPWSAVHPGAAIRDALADWAQAAPYPLVLFLDEIDALQGAVLLSILRATADRLPGAASGRALVCRPVRHA